MQRDRFQDFHPGIQFLFFIAVIVFSMCFVHPAFVVCSVLFSACYLFLLRGNKAWQVIAMTAMLFLVLSLVNPLFNTNGEHVLFTWAGGRPYCLEPLCYGMALGGMTASVLLWFACYNTVMTSDKFLQLVGKRIPSLSLVLTMVMRLVPDYMRKTKQISGARSCIGKAGPGDLKTRLNDGGQILSSLTNWALEGGISRADSMKSRGFGTGWRSSFSMYRWSNTDKVLLAGLIAIIAAIILFAALGAASVTYIPQTVIAPLSSTKTAAAVIIYIICLSIPTVMNLVEIIIWHNLRSKI